MNEFEQSATLIKNELKARDFNGAWKEFSREVLSLEQRRTSQANASKREGEYFSEVIQQSEELKKLGFPTAALHQRGDKLEMVFSDPRQGTPNLEWTSFTRQNQNKSSHDLTLQEVSPPSELKALTAREDKTGKPLEASVQGDEIAWQQWQDRLNKSIMAKLDLYSIGQNFEHSYHAAIRYKVGRNGSFHWNFTELTGSDEYRRAVQRSIDDTLRYHPELIKFPEGTTRQEIERNTTFGIGEPGFKTGPVETELIKK
jgi:hypothetical protein